MAAMAEPGRGLAFRPCIDLHDGKVKQIVGSTLSTGAAAEAGVVENFVSGDPPAYFAELYRKDGLRGGHVIMLGKGNEAAALAALSAWPGGLQVGGGVTPSNAMKYIDAGASHVIVTSFVFRDGKISFENLDALVAAVGKDRLVLDLSCRRKPPKDGEAVDEAFYVVTDRWQKFTDFAVTPENLAVLANYCSEFLVHGVDVEGMQCGILEDLVGLLGQHSPIPVTYAGGARSMEDVELVNALGAGKVDLTIGSALDIFGGDLSYAQVVEYHRRNHPSAAAVEEQATPRSDARTSREVLPVTAESLGVQWASTPAPKTPVLGFYSHTKGEYTAFSNFYEHSPIDFTIPDCCRTAAFVASGRSPMVSGITYAEKSIMLCKAAVMGDMATFDAILASREPRKTKALGRQVTPFNQDTWDKVVCTVAREAVTQKFRAHSSIKRVLLNTAPAILAEATRNDRVWGIGIDVGKSQVQDPTQWRGTNILGWALMEARAILAKEEEAA